MVRSEGSRDSHTPIIAPVAPTAHAALRLRPLGLANARIDGGLWGERRETNRELSIPHGASMLMKHGNLVNFEIAMGAPGEYQGENDDGGTTAPFLDSDVYKWLEAVGWELAQAERPDLRALAEPMIELVVRTQRPDGYIDTFYQVPPSGREFTELEWGHELYVAGHLVQAAVAWKRGLDDDRLLGVAERFVARIESEIGPGRREAICGHPEFEMALVELYRTTGERRYLEFARVLVDRRGHGLLNKCGHGPRYWQDHEPVRTAPEPAGHAVRQMYLDCGVVDVAVELGDRDLLESALRRWEAMLASFSYVTGGLGAHHRDEAFGAAFELPPDRAYAETCAAIGSAMLSWRLLLATGEERFADLIERTTYNAILPALALDGSHFFYSNPLMRRSTIAEVLEGNATTSRTAWPAIACCPPNLMRFLATLPDVAVTSDAAGLQIHQYVSGTFGSEVADGRLAMAMRTRYPWEGRVEVVITATVDRPWTLSARVPSWCSQATATIGKDSVSNDDRVDRIEMTRVWRVGDVMRLDFDMPPRLIAPDPRIDAVRACIALERGPLVYAVEDADLPDGASIESLEIGPQPTVEAVLDSGGDLGEMVWLSFAGFIRSEAARRWPYSPVGSVSGASGSPAPIRALPYFAWGNRHGLGMRVWLPTRS